MVTNIVIAVHVIVSIGLVALILLHAGRGGGLSDVFGGGMGPASLSGSTVDERNLDRITVAVAIVFATTTLVLSWLLN